MRRSFSNPLAAHLVLAKDVALADDKEQRVRNLPGGARDGHGDGRLHLERAAAQWERGDGRRDVGVECVVVAEKEAAAKEREIEKERERERERERGGGS